MFGLMFGAGAAFAQGPVREGLGFQHTAAPAFLDEHILQAVQNTVADSGIAPVISLTLGSSGGGLDITVTGATTSKAFACRVDASGGVICGPGGAVHPSVPHAEIQLAHFQAHGFTSQELWSHSSVAAWVAVAVVGIYAAKKILNKLATGRFRASEHGEHHSLFPSEEKMREELVTNRKLLETSLANNLMQLAAPLVFNAGCGHDHHHHGHHSAHSSPGFHCEGVSDTTAAAARESLLRSFPGFAAAFAKDFHKELIAPIVALGAAAKDANVRRQIFVFTDLIARRLVKERGVPAAVATGVLVGAGQLVVEVLESFVLPAGAHMFCQIGNVAVLAAAASAYSTYFCMTQTQEFKGQSWAERWRVARRLARANKPALQPLDAESGKIQQLNQLFRLVERDLRHARSLDVVSSAESRRLAWQLGQVKKELNLLSIRLLNGMADDESVLNWLKNLYILQSSATGTASCEHLLAKAS